MLITTEERRLLAAGLATGDRTTREATKAEELHTALILAAQELHDALDGHHQASEKLAEAKRHLLHEETVCTVAGVGGSNAQERAAYLRADLKAEHNAVDDAESDLAAERVRVEQARLAWDLARYRVRLEVGR